MTAGLSKSKIDRLGDRLRKGLLSEADLRLLDEYRRSFRDAYEVVVHSIRERLQLETTGRPAKSTGSIIEKLRRETIRLSQVQDIAGCRLVVTDIAEQGRVVASLREIFPSRSVVDRRMNPSYGYRAVHVIIEVSGKAVEIQVRTLLQHMWAELSEKFSDVIDPNIKYGAGEPEIRQVLEGTSRNVARLERFETRISALKPGKEQQGELEGLQQEMAVTKEWMINDLRNLIDSLDKMKRDDP